MDLGSLQLKSTLDLGRSKRRDLDWLEADTSQLLLAPLFTAEEGEKGIVQLSLPKDFELDHLAKDLVIPVSVENSDISGLLLTVEEMEPQPQDSWEKLLAHLEERIGQMARIHPRITVPEFNLTVKMEVPLVGSGRVFDLSEGGMRILLDQDLGKEEPIAFVIGISERLRLVAATDELECRGIVRNKYAHGYGIEFERNHPFRRRIKRIVDEVTQLRSQELRYPRYEISKHSIQALATSEEEPLERETIIRDISTSGAYLLANKTLPAGMTVNLRVQPNKIFHHLEEPLNLTGYIVRDTPDGIAICFRDLKQEESERLNEWIQEIADTYRTTPKQEEVKPKTTLSIKYGNDLLFVREYLYNLSSGGFFLPGNFPVETGDTVRFVIDLSGTELAKQFSEPPNFLGAVVRKTDEGIGVQFLDPDAVRLQLEDVIGDYFRRNSRKPQSQLTNAAEHAAAQLEKSAALEAQAIKEHRRTYLTPQTVILSIAILTLSITMVLLYGQGQFARIRIGSLSRTQPKKVRPKYSAEERRKAGGPILRKKFLENRGPRAFPSLLKRKNVPKRFLARQEHLKKQSGTPYRDISNGIKVPVGNDLRAVSLDEITDVDYDFRTGPKVILRSGETAPAGPFKKYLDPALQEKLKDQKRRVLREQAQNRLAPPLP